MSIERRQFPQFFITNESPCPYLPDRLERKVFTHLVGNDAAQLHDVLSAGGFRRSQNIAYRPSCESCTACVSVRIVVDQFRWTKSFKRIMRNNKHLVSEATGLTVTSEHYALFADYINTRHHDGGMADMTAQDFISMVSESAVETRLIEYRHRPAHPLADPDPQRGPLAAAALTDVLGDGLSMIYSFFDPEMSENSPGTYMVLDHINRAQKLGLPYVYLGFWVDGSQKMAYKSRFLPQQRLSEDGWVTVGA